MALSKESKLHKDIQTLLEEGKLHEAFRIMREQLRQRADSRLLDKVNNLEETYKYMIHYMVEGYSDTGREKMLADIRNQLATVNDLLLKGSELPASTDIYSSTLRFENIRKATLRNRLDDYRQAASKAELERSITDETSSSSEFGKEEEQTLSALFSYVWTMFGAPTEDYTLLRKAVTEEDLPYSFRSMMISALLLGGMKYYDSKGLSLLLDIYEADLSPKLSAQALTAIFLIVARHPERIKTDPSISDRLTLWQDALTLYPRLREVLMNILRARDTERINNKMKNELIPELMKMRPEIINKLKNASEEMDMEGLEENPEWEELLNKNGIGDKLKELTELQMEGGDVMMMAFSNLKGFPFFNTVSNWFLPFTSRHTDVSLAGIEGLSNFSELLDMEGVMCDSDKYSFALSLRTMPEEQRKLISDRMGVEMGQLRDIMNEKREMPGFSDFNAEVTRYLRNLYRFFKLYRKKEDFTDPFRDPVDFQALPYLCDILGDNEILNLVGEFYFKRGYYAEALPIMLRLESNGCDVAQLWEKIGYCYNSLGNYSEALAWYRKAELLNPDSQWLIKKIALTCRLLNRQSEAAEYYTKALLADPDNYKLLISAGNCLLECGNASEALKHYYHAEYVRPDRLSTRRAIAWGELLNAQFEKSRQYYDLILAGDETTDNDYLNAGHAAYLSRDLKKAVEFYVKSAQASKDGIARLEKAIEEDMPVIEKAGGNRDEMNILMEKVRYEVK